MRLEFAVKRSTADCLQVTAPIGPFPKTPKARVLLSDPTPIQLPSNTGGINAFAMNCGIERGTGNRTGNSLSVYGSNYCLLSEGNG